VAVGVGDGDWQRLSDLLCLNRPKKVGQVNEGLNARKWCHFSLSLLAKSLEPGKMMLSWKLIL